MTLHSSLRIIQLAGLVVFGTGALYAMLRYAVAIFNLNFVYTLALLAATTTLYYCVTICNELARKRRITKFASGFSITAALLAVSFACFTAIGLIKDISDVYCSGIMGGSMACVMQPTLAVGLWISLLPQVMIFIGLFALAGIYNQYRHSRS